MGASDGAAALAAERAAAEADEAAEQKAAGVAEAERVRAWGLLPRLGTVLVQGQLMDRLLMTPGLGAWCDSALLAVWPAAVIISNASNSLCR